MYNMGVASGHGFPTLPQLSLITVKLPTLGLLPLALGV